MLNELITNAIEDITTKKVLSSSSSARSDSKTKNPTIKSLNTYSQDISVYTDKWRISQIVSNLFDNAI